MARRTSALNPLPLARRNALYKGLLGGQRSWMAIGVLVWVPKLIKRALGKNPEVVAVERLQPGQVLRLEALPQETKAQRKRFRRTDGD